MEGELASAGRDPSSSATSIAYASIKDWSKIIPIALSCSTVMPSKADRSTSSDATPESKISFRRGDKSGFRNLN